VSALIWLEIAARHETALQSESHDHRDILDPRLLHKDGAEAGREADL